MTDRTTDRLVVHLPSGRKSLVDAYAKQQGYEFTSDYIRRLIEADMEANGESIDLAVDRGGYRGRKEELEDG